MENQDRREDSGEEEAFKEVTQEEMKTNFPVFMKVVLILFLFAFLPFLLLALLVVWNYDAAFHSFFQDILLPEKEKFSLDSQWRDVVHDLRIKVGFFLLLFSGFLFFGILLTSRLLLRPLAKFLEGVRRLIRGDFGTKIRVDTNDEFALFSTYFNQMSQQLERGRQRDAWISRMKTQLLALAAHQLRTPLTAIKWIFNEFLAGSYGSIKDQQKNALENGLASTERMIHLINSLIDITAIEEGRFQYRFRMTDMVFLVKDTIKALGALGESRQVKLEVHIEPNLPQVYIDAEKMKLAIENLLSNALYYTPSRGRATLSLTRRKIGKMDEIVLSVEDTGIGIAQGEIEKIFTQFFRGREASQMHHTGSGLGLFITKNIVERHGGKISATSEEGKGSIFTITIPISVKQIPEGEFSQRFILGE